MPTGADGPASPLTLAVIGHVDHGKTALVRALTGIETDRLKEEIERGLSITLGFAWRDYAAGGVDFIDTPGHEDFIRAMVIGATGARAVLLVVSSVEGFGRQTWEHLRIAELLGVGAGVVAVTKADRLAPDEQEAMRTKVEATLSDTFLAGAPMVFCSSISGQGLEELHGRLAALATGCPPAEPLAGAFLPIDRAFTITGTGAVVTGTLQGGSLRSGGEAILLPSGRKVGLRQIQVHGAGVDEARSGGRVAVALRGVSANDIRAGEALCAPDVFSATLQVDVLLTVARESPRALKHMDQLGVLWGARRDTASARLLGGKSIEPGGQGLAQLRFAAPVIAFAGQRAVLRRLSPAETIGGALVLDPVATPSRGRPGGRLALLEAVVAGEPEAIAARLADRDGGVASVAEVARLSRRPAAEIRGRLKESFVDLAGGRLAQKGAAAAARAAYLDELAAAHRQAPTRAAVSVGLIRDRLAPPASRDLIAHVERALAAAGEIRLDAALVALAGQDPVAALSAPALARLSRLETALREGGLTPPDPAVLAGADGEDRDLLRMLIESGRAAPLRNVALRQDLVFHRDALRAAAEVLRVVFPPPSRFTTGEARAALGTSRKFIVPVLEEFDARGLTARHGDVRQMVDPAAPPPGPAPADA